MADDQYRPKQHKRDRLIDISKLEAVDEGIWYIPRVWMLLAFGYCVPGPVVLSRTSSLQHPYFWGTLALIAVGAGVVGRRKGWSRAIDIAGLMIVGSIVGAVLGIAGLIGLTMGG